MSGLIQNKAVSTLFNATFSKIPAKNGQGLDPADFHTYPGALQDIYNKVAQSIGLNHVKADAKKPADPLVVRQLYRDNSVFHLGNVTPSEQAKTMVTALRSTGILGGSSIDTTHLASWMMEIKRDAPGKAIAIENAVMAQLGNVGDQSAFAAALRTAASHPAKADIALLAMGKDAPISAPPPRAQIIADTNAIITDATSKDTFSVKGEVFAKPVTFSTERVVAQLSALAETNPVKAQLIRSELTTRLVSSEAAAMNRMLAGEASVLEGLTIGLNDPGDAAIGAVKGVANDVIGIANVLGRGEAMRQAGEAQQSADILRLFGNEKAAGQMDKSAEIMRQAGQQDAIPSIPYKNAAQQGGANMVTAAELASGAGTLAKGVYVGGKWVAKNAPELFAKGLRFIDNTLILDANKGAQFILDGKARRIGDAPTVKGGKATDIDGNAVTVRSPKSYDSVKPNDLGGKTYTKDGISIKYDANGFPVFNSKADVYLDAKHIKSSDKAAHFRAANEMLGDALKADPRLAKKMGLSDTDVKHLTKAPPSDEAIKGYTWHHHQDTGKMQLVLGSENKAFPHLGGMSLWGGKYSK